jgi:hypothetical protein
VKVRAPKWSSTVVRPARISRDCVENCEPKGQLLGNKEPRENNLHFFLSRVIFLRCAAIEVGPSPSSSQNLSPVP